VIVHLTAPTGNPATVRLAVTQDQLLLGIGKKIHNSQLEEGKTPGRHVMEIRDFRYTKLNNPRWCATWPHCNIAKAVVVKLSNFKSVLPNNCAGREYRCFIWEQSSTIHNRGSRFRQICAHRNESVIIVLFGSEVARVWFGQLQITCG
jgi:hypothetical protein